jgi:hypothetical protein
MAENEPASGPEEKASKGPAKGRRAAQGGDPAKDLIEAPRTPTSSQYGTNEAVKAQGDKVLEQNSQQDLAGGSYATTGLAAPLTPSDQHTQVVPVLGDPDTSTNHVSTSAGLLTYPGEQHVGLVDENGDEVDPDSLFEDPGEHTTYVTAKGRVFEQFRYPGTTEVATRLFYTAGARVDRGEARRLKEAVRLQRQYGL